MSQKATICWTDIPVTNLERAIRFYSSVLGEPVTHERAEGFEFGLLPHDDERVSGCLSVMEDNAPSEKGPLIYLSVDGRIDEALDQVSEGGGAVLKGKEQIGPWGYRALIRDSEGNRVALHSQTP